VLEIFPCDGVIAACHGRPEALDELPDALALVLRTAPDEAWLVASRSRREGLLRSASLWLASADPGGVVVDQTDGWSIYSLPGPDGAEVWGRISVTALPRHRPAFLQGALSGVPGKALVADQALFLFVPASVGHHLEARLLATCVDLGASIGAPSLFTFGPKMMAETVR